MLRVILAALLMQQGEARTEVAQEMSAQELFRDFLGKYPKDYDQGSEEWEARLKIFSHNVVLIRAHNAAEHSWKMAVNQWADLTAEEMQAHMHGFKPSDRKRQVSAGMLTGVLPNSVDWRTKGVVNGILNQYQCGACWAFSAAASVESAWALKHGALVNVSEQELVDCSGKYGNEGCQGGSMDQAFEYIGNKSKLCSGNDYKYSAQTGFCFSDECQHDIGVRLSGFVDLPFGNETQLQAAVATVGVVSVGIQANQTGFQFYKSGVFDGECGRALDHAVALVGYEVDPISNNGYWLLRNSWGKAWGEEGYMRLTLGKNLCGVADAASYPLVG